MSDRKSLLTALRAINVDLVHCEYSGSGDEGFIDLINTNPHPIDRDLKEKLDDFFWESVIGQTEHDGFHNNDGGYGVIDWDITTDKIVMKHTDYIQDTVTHPDVVL